MSPNWTLLSTGAPFHDANWFHRRPSGIRGVAEALASHWACAQGEGGFWLKGPWPGIDWMRRVGRRQLNGWTYSILDGIRRWSWLMRSTSFWSIMEAVFGFSAIFGFDQPWSTRWAVSDENMQEVVWRFPEREEAQRPKCSKIGIWNR